MRIRNYIIALVFLSLFFVLGKTPSKAAVYQSCSPGVQCTLTCSVHDTYYFSAYNGSDPIVYASCTGHLDGTCTFSRENYKPNNYQISCGSSGGGGGGSGAPTCDEQHAAVLPEWRNPLGDTFYENSIIPLEYKATSNTSIGRPAYNEKPHTVVLLKRAYTPNVVVCDSHVNNFAPCTMEILPDSECPGCDPTSGGRCCVIIRHPDLMPVMKANTNPAAGQSLFIPWVVEVKVEPWWGATCKASGTFNVVSCNDDCPSPICTISESDCGTGYTLTNTGPHCVAHNATCRQTTGCGNQKVCNSAQCYRTEANITKPSSPTNPRITIDAYAFNLSTTEYTRIKKPLPGQGESAVAISATAPSSSSGRNPTFDFNAENYGVNSEWADTWDNCNGVVGEDFCTLRKAENTIPFKSASLSASQILKEGATGILALRYNTQNICNDNIKSSDYIYPRYQVDRLPTVQDISVTGTPNIVRGCSANSYTGIEANRTLTITVRGSDADGVDDINGLSLWFVKDGVGDISDDINKITDVGPFATETNQMEIGVFLADYDRNLSNPVTIYKAVNSGGTLQRWGRDATGTGSLGTTRVQDQNDRTLISSIGVTRLDINATTKEYIVTLEFPQDAPISGKYNIYAGFTDIFTYATRTSPAGTYVELQNLKQTTQSWNFDFINPTITNVGTSIDDSRILTLNWNSHDVGSTIRSNHTIVNVYKNEDPQPVMRTVPPPNSEVTPGSRPLTSLIGDYAPLVSGWRFLSSGDNREMKISTGLNTGGNLYFYITAYDNACNMGQVDSSSVPQINLDKWVHTKGGIFYSKGTVNYATKPAVSPDYFNLGTELISSESNSINTINIINNPLNNRNPAVAKSITDINNNTGQYDSLKENFDRIEPNLKPATVNGSNITCSEPLGCKWNTTTVGDISYTGKIIAYSDTDITINGEIKNIGFGANQNKDGMIIFSGGSITINGSTLTGSSLHADTIAAWLLAKENVVLAAGSVVANDYQDQVIVDGGIIAFGESGTNLPAFQLSRTLGLYNITHPVLITNFHPKYSTISSLFFGLHIPAYKREVGFKSI